MNVVKRLRWWIVGVLFVAVVAVFMWLASSRSRMADDLAALRKMGFAVNYDEAQAKPKLEDNAAPLYDKVKVALEKPPYASAISILEGADSLGLPENTEKVRGAVQTL